MKRVLITGANSYIGMSVEKWLLRKEGLFQVDVLDVKDEKWQEYEFANYDVVFHVAGIAHQKETEDNKELYYKVNRDLAIAVAQKAKVEGVKQFIILSSVSVYGMNCGTITKDTVENPVTHYGKSKYQADLEIMKLQEADFHVCTLRPPMVYGKGCKGNYQLLRKFALKSPIFPRISNGRSMIYITNLAAFVEKMIEENCSGLFFPQNKEYVCTSDMVEKIANVHQKKICFIRLFNWIITLTIRCKIKLFEKVFGTLVYEKVDLCDWVSFEESILETEQ